MQISIAIWNKNIVNFCMSWLLRPVHKAGGQFDSPLQLLRKDFLHFFWLNTCVKNFPMIWWKENYHKKINTQNSYSWVPNNRPTHFFQKLFQRKQLMSTVYYSSIPEVTLFSQTYQRTYGGVTKTPTII